ncbi:MAG: hypothetical protein RJA81_966 [Planctomycetota bacterium]
MAESDHSEHNSLMDSGETHRLFYAVMLSPELVDTIRRIQSRARIDLPSGIRWVRPDQAHITLAFLGDVNASLIPELSTILDDVVSTYQPLQLKVEGIGGFPRAEKPRVIWAGIHGTDLSQLISLHHELWARLQTIMPPSEFAMKEFHPHVTLARVPGAQPHRLAEWMKKHAGWSFGKLCTTEIVLMKSILTDQGPVYSALTKMPLQLPSPEKNQKS